MPRTKKKVKSIVKTKVISARVTETAYELLHRQAEDAGMTLSEFTAQMLMKGRVNTSYVFYVHPDEIEAIWNLKGEKQRFVTESISRQNRARKRQKTTFVRRNRHRRFTTAT